MSRIPNPPRDGHPGKPPRRRNATKEIDGQTIKPHSYGQSAEMPEPAKDSESKDLIDLEPDSIEDLAGEPMREDDDDEKPRQQ